MNFDTRQYQRQYQLLLTAALLFCASLGATSAAAQPQTSIIIPGMVLMPDGTLAEGKAVVIRNGRIHSIDEADEHRDRDDAIRRPGTVLSPGLIDPYAVLGAYGSNVERVHAIDPDLSVYDAIDSWDAAWADVLAGGVTTAMIVPGPNNLVGGMTAVMRTGNERRPPEELRERAMMMFSFGSPALHPQRPPTSHGGAISMLRNAFSQPHNGRGHARLAQVLDGTVQPIVRADSGEDVTAALRFFETYGIGPVIAHTSHLLDVRDDLIEADVPVIVGPYSVRSSQRELVAPGRLQKEGVELAFAGLAPIRDAASMRLSAALAVRAGLDADAARRGLTINPATILGIDSQVGSISPGRDADLVLFSGDPLRPDARVLAVYLRGELVHVAPNLHEEIARLDPDEVDDEMIGASDDDTE